ncbi:cell division protein FtsZ [Candidatus Nomurabacteria bacterium RIFCSPLOWO2_01_FULL_40_18]|uniref:Cell division protein FtsZ n=1 Tax=Candidatus Nomurabacteria bacterium RIFCSPLOWO2_01_FULL_40_18 TaxID=1801773 RepID=A0A1F6XK05_9BACT|nr:MAG: cell division protein FtsZ [Candidatus Nomurabacteria bacterium RIFCSPLOWO2_01_FULL_40_18]
MPKINQEIQSFARIMVIGIGGSGKNAINHMINSKIKGVSFICMNTDTQDLHHSLADKKIHIGKNLTKGLGAGMDPEVGKKAAEETKSEIQDVIKGADMIFIACGMGGGTGTGAAPIVARAAKEQGILTVAVTTKPFFFEGNHRMKIAEKGIEELSKEVDAIIVIPNDKLLQLSDKNTNFKDAFASADNVLLQAVEGISDLITTPGIINVDFADIKAVMRDAGSALMGIGVASGEKRAEKAALAAINSPLLEVSIHGAKGVLFAISGGDDLTIHEIQEAAKIITESIDKDAKVIFGTIRDEKLKKGEIKVTVIATNFPADTPRKSLFSGSDIGGKAGQTLLKDENVAMAKKEINNSINSIKSANTGNPMSNVSSNDFIKKMDNKKGDNKKNDDIIIDDDTDDWSAIPAFLRRKK